MGNMRFKVGDRVRIKSIDWYNKNKDSNGNVVFSSKVTHFSWCENVRTVFTKDMSKFCGKVVTIEIVWTVNYSIVEGTHRDYFTDEMIEGLVEEECPQDFIEKYCKSCGTQRCDRTKEFLDGCPHYNAYMCEKQNNDMEEETSQNAKLVSERFSEYVNPSEFKYAQDTITKMLLQGANIPNEYILKDENGNIINATKIVLEKKKKEYPKTYEECCKVLEIEGNSLLINTKHITDYERDLGNLMGQLHRLRICRDAYWKIAGEEM